MTMLVIGTITTKDSKGKCHPIVGHEDPTGE